MIETLLQTLTIVFDPSRLVFMFLGIMLGLTIGLLPGLSGTVGMSILLPFVYGMDPFTGMALLIGMVAVVHTGDTFPSVLLGIPGSSGSQATIMDGFPLAQKGQASRALGAAFFCSMIGGVIGGIVLFLVVPFVRPLVLAFGSPELFMLALLGLSMVGILSGKRPIIGVVAGLFGMLLGTIGSAPAVPDYRYTFDWLYLYNGLPLPLVALGLFAFPVLIDLLVSNQSISKGAKLSGSWFNGVKDSLNNKWLMFRSSALGSAAGFVPGLGGSVVDWLSYGLAKQTSKKNDEFGKGDIRGVIAPESANNAKEGGALIPTLMFGIPGSGTTAILLGGLLLMGVEAGPQLVTTELSLTMSIIWTLIIANVFGAIACLLLIKPIAKFSTIHPTKLVPFLAILLILGAYQTSQHWGDLLAFVVLGMVGWVMKQLDWPRAPVLIGFVLALSAERYLWISFSRFGTEWLTRPGVMIIGVLIVVILVSGLLMNRKKRSNETFEDKGVRS
ncbi:tripartite tricarboxylate transporter permease [Desertibacillus haloalkaliphilus]|uniref:tripartite tricarboxylate transporter permease n=1 Tax=Desertibacillus haloalkaliphilus TaxID=1328930 RepID=UPI001C254950|nr:tripartite tricarboxylate transporter permease [Desertibacillus haloalkaliphilus]MBU8905999.1 tripartite tricarboxylate transporter permease [Desertibacillus haloalkaliphilus]